MTHPFISVRNREPDALVFLDEFQYKPQLDVSTGCAFTPWAAHIASTSSRSNGRLRRILSEIIHGNG